ncbi:MULTISPECIES: LamG-like jellyroll fold domain-containing protein [unclassified Flavobacterium]|uniref:LamG-like jellyroll fold domain-containing protein n=1 Tax=unclassified Flavobacterium TaxID=196869 RepID=UPI003F92C3D3
MIRKLPITFKILSLLAFIIFPLVNFAQSHTILYENFDSSNGGWNSTTTNGKNGSWIYNANPIVGEGSYWSINPYNTYLNNSYTTLTSPVYSTAGFNTVTFYIDIRYKTELNWDGMNIEYTTDATGNTGWTVLGSQGQGKNWYNDNDVNGIAANVHGWSGQNTETNASPSKFIEASISSTDIPALNNRTSLRFRVNFGSDESQVDSGVAIDNVIIKGEFITAPGNPSKGPGNINSNLKLWLKADAGTSTITNNTAVTQWNDQAFNNNANGYGSFAPKFRNDVARNINFNPVIDFSRSASNVLKGKGGYWSQDYFIVVKTNTPADKTTTNSQELISGRIVTDNFAQDGTGLGLGRISSRFNSDNLISHMIGSYTPNGTPATTDSYGKSYSPSSVSTTSNNVMILNVKSNANTTEIYLNGKKIDSHTATNGTSGTGAPLNFSEFNNSIFQLGVGRFTLNGFVAGGSVFNTYLDGRMTEVISYSTPRANLDQQKIQSYLAIKNGVTLHAKASTTTDDLCDINYIDTAANIIWNYTSNTGYNFDIAGIGRDDNSVLNQKQSKTDNNSQDITIGLGDLSDTNSSNLNTFDTDKKFLMWGNNHGSLSAQTPITANLSSGITSPSALTTDVSFTAIGRTWKVVETGGNVPTVKVSIPAAMLNNTVSGLGDYLMFISNSPTFDASSEYRIMTANGSNLETTYDFDGTKYISFGYAPEKTFSRAIKFNGTTNYLDAGKVLNLNNAFTISAWVNRTFTNKTILSKRNSSFSEGYDLSINSAGKAEMSWIVGGTKHTITSNAVIPANIWHHIAVIYNGATAKMYVDGVTVVSKSMPTVPANSQSFLIGAADGVSTTSFFTGAIDEVRVWSVALNDAQLRYVMNQEIQSNGNLTNGVIIPNTITKNDIKTIPWAYLNAYYPMSTYTYASARDISNNKYSALLKNIKTVDRQTAPLPYESQANGLWQTPATWLNNTVQDLPNSIAIEDGTTPIDWNIVKTGHAVTSQGNKTLLGLFVTASTLSATTISGQQTEGTKIEISHYLKLDGKIDLVGRSQLIQKTGSELDPSSSGSLERDQQGQTNKYNYNYWSSPVSTISATINNGGFSLSTVLKDGTNAAAPATINWIAGYDGSPTTPISLARYWIYKFDNLANAYANWTQLSETSILSAGKGFTLKGSGAATATQNLTFVGKPNNGTISNAVGANQLLLTGNPYPSALDAEQFITDNLNASPSINGTLYFWEHYDTNNTHILRSYQGGYAIRNMSGGTPTSSVGVNFISGAGTSSKKAPNRYIPVGQAFFVVGNNSSGGNVTFNNSQRDFHKEDETGVSQTTYKNANNTAKKDHWTDDSNAAIENDGYQRIYLGFNAYNEEFHRQVLLAFMNDKADSEINNGYDAKNFDNSPTDLYLLNGTTKLAIEGEGYFNIDKQYPLGIKTASDGKISIGIDKLENFDKNTKLYILDKETATYHNIKNDWFEIELPTGVFNDRFFLCFKKEKSKMDKSDTLDTAEFKPTEDSNVLVTLNKNVTVLSPDNEIKEIMVYDLLGRMVDSYKQINASTCTLNQLSKTSSPLILKITLTDATVTTKKIVF